QPGNGCHDGDARARRRRTVISPIRNAADHTKGSTMKKYRHITAIAALGLTASLALTGCATGNDTAGGDSEDSADDKGTITLGFLPSWTDGLSMAYLLQDQFEKLGYTVEMQTLTEAGPLYTGLA